MPPDVLNELHYSMLLCYTGRSRRSDPIIDAQVDGYVRRQEDVLRAMDELKEIATALKNALLQGRLDDFGALLHQAWLNKKRMAAQISTPHIDALYATACSSGALGGKISGAGGGGYMFFYCPFDRKHIVAAQLADICELQLSYAIGVAEPTSVLVSTEGTGKLSDDMLGRLVRKHFPLTPRAIIEHLKLRRPIYRETAAHGHFGRNLPNFTWEKCDKAGILKEAAAAAV